VSRRVLAVLAVLLAVSTGLAVPGRARAQQPGPALEVVLVSISPVVGPRTPLAYRVEVRNRGQVPLRDLSVQVLVGQPVATRSDLADLLATPGGPTQGLAELDGFAPPGAEVAAGSALRLEQRRVAVPPELGAGSAGAVLPLSVRVQAFGPGPLTARLGTFAVRLPARPDRPLRAALLVPFHEPPHRNTSGEFVDDRLAGLLAPSGPLGAAAAELARPGAPRLTMVVDGLLVEEATAMAASWTAPRGWDRDRGAGRRPPLPRRQPLPAEPQEGRQRQPARRLPLRQRRPSGPGQEQVRRPGGPPGRP
jgi:hypothetical protein